MKSFESHGVGRSAKPLLGVRRQPGRLALAVFRLPLPLYRRGWGWLLGHTFLLLVHAGRKTGKLHSTGFGTFKSVRRCRSRSGGSRTNRSSASSRRTRASLWWSSSDGNIPGGCASSPGSWAGTIFVLIGLHETSSAVGRSCRFAPPTPRGSDVVRLSHAGYLAEAAGVTLVGAVKAVARTLPGTRSA
jgi:hypothetical protein